VLNLYNCVECRWVGRNRDSEPISGSIASRRFVLLKVTTDRHEASRGLFVTAELLVFSITCTGAGTIGHGRARAPHFGKCLDMGGNWSPKVNGEES